MKHDCRIGYLEVSEDKDGYLFLEWKKVFGSVTGPFRIEYCPICGMKAKKSHIEKLQMFSRDIPPAPEEPLSLYSSMITQAINDMNRNIASIKAFMISQNCQNECFMDRDLQTSQKLSEITRRLQALEELNDHKIP